MNRKIDTAMEAEIMAAHTQLEADKMENIRASLSQALATQVLARIEAVNKPRYYSLELVQMVASGEAVTTTEPLGKNDEIDLSRLTLPEEVVTLTARLVASMTTTEGTKEIGTRDLGAFSLSDAAAKEVAAE